MKISKESKQTLTKFKGWDDELIVYPSGRFIISNMKKANLPYDLIVEGWLNEKFDAVNTVCMSSLKSGQYIHINIDSDLEKIDPAKFLKAEPALNFSLSQWDMKAFKILAKTQSRNPRASVYISNAEFVTIINVDEEIERVVYDDSNGQTGYIDIHTKIEPSSIEQIRVSSQVLRLLPLDEYHITCLSNDRSIFRAGDSGLTFYAKKAIVDWSGQDLEPEYDDICQSEDVRKGT